MSRPALRKVLSPCATGVLLGLAAIGPLRASDPPGAGLAPASMVGHSPPDFHLALLPGFAPGGHGTPPGPHIRERLEAWEKEKASLVLLISEIGGAQLEKMAYLRSDILDASRESDRTLADPAERISGPDHQAQALHEARFLRRFGSYPRNLAPSCSSWRETPTMTCRNGCGSGSTSGRTCSGSGVPGGDRWPRAQPDVPDGV